MSPTKQRQRTTKTTVPRQRAAEGGEVTVTETERPSEDQGPGVTLPVVHTRVPLPTVGLPPANSTRGRVLWFGGLGALAVVGVLDWPVAAAVAAGTWIAERSARERMQRERQETEGD